MRRGDVERGLLCALLLSFEGAEFVCLLCWELGGDVRLGYCGWRYGILIALDLSKF